MVYYILDVSKEIDDDYRVFLDRKLVGRSGVYVIPDMHEEKTVRLTGFQNAEVVYCWANSEEFAKNIIRHISASLRQRLMAITPEDRSGELTRYQADYAGSTLR